VDELAQVHDRFCPEALPTGSLSSIGAGILLARGLVQNEIAQSFSQSERCFLLAKLELTALHSHPSFNSGKKKTLEDKL
jgi:hypothetical protein